MAKLQDQQGVFGPYAYYTKPATLVIEANGGSVRLEVLADEDSDTWIVDHLFEADGVHKLEVNNATVRLTPIANARYSFDVAQ